ncbi:hypothetical protein Acr_04g0002260 [Actinidia rufa]|uniref:Uncharacterized protein n=1 Tax=Actinidia rufa TaxID=165716 RepID=A0A7J0EG87_9ERIC|nr:hypothetical protein Acr_04g0002260 [Actinidia rufa]
MTFCILIIAIEETLNETRKITNPKSQREGTSNQSEGHFSKKPKNSTSQQQHSARSSPITSIASSGQTSRGGLICFGCHQPGHRVMDCPLIGSAGSEDSRAGLHYDISSGIVGDSRVAGATVGYFGCTSFDVILGMDWLTGYRATIDCVRHRVTFRTPEGDRFYFVGDWGCGFIPSSTDVRRQGELNFLFSACLVDESSTSVALPPIVYDFPNVFPEDLTELPPHREIEFSIDLIPGTAPISVPPYHFAPAELQELKIQIQDLLDKGFIRPSASLWGASALFAKKKDGSLRIKCEFWLPEVKFLGHVVLGNEVAVDSSKIEALGKVIAYGSRQLKTHEQNYSTHGLELAAVIFALKSWRHYLYGEWFEVFLDHKSLKYLFTQKDLNLRQQCWMEYMEDYDFELHYHPGKANVVADTLSKKSLSTLASISIHEWKMLQDLAGLLQPLPVAEWKWEHITMDFVSGLPRSLRGHDTVWVVVNRLTKSAHFLPIRLSNSAEELGIIYVREIVRLYGVPISIVSDRDPHFTSLFWKGMQSILGSDLRLSISFHPQTDGQSNRTIQILEDMLRACVLDFGGSWEDHLHLVEFAYNNSYQARIGMAPFEAFYGRPCRSPMCWTDVGEVALTKLDWVCDTTEKVVLIRKCLLMAQSRQKNYADRRKCHLEFTVGDHVFLKVSPKRGIMRFRHSGKLSPRFIGPFEILDHVGAVAYRFALPSLLANVHNVFHVSML